MPAVIGLNCLLAKAKFSVIGIKNYRRAEVFVFPIVNPFITVGAIQLFGFKL